ncbi:MAG: hypothetical protein IJQ16_06985 [Selenomonadaceae bacterium]|nr:hypothetical protein [Selenomonadaceae bacterium]
MTKYEIEYIIARVVQNSQYATDEAKDDPGEFNEGRKFAYYEVLDTIKNELLVREQNLKDYGYDENWEQRLMF